MTKKERALYSHLYPYLTRNRAHRIDSVLKQRTRWVRVVMENVYIDRNEGAIMRSCDAFGIQDVHLINHQPAAKLTRNMARGAEKWLTKHAHSGEDATGTLDCIEYLRNKGVRVIATAPEASKTLHDLSLEQPIALAFGTEKEGITSTMKKHADELIRIPMLGFTESLNVSVAAALLLQNCASRLREEHRPWQLSSAEQEQLRLEWTIKSIKNAPSLLKRFEEEWNAKA